MIEKMIKYGWYTLFIAMVGDVLLSLVFPWFYTGYSSMKMSISALGNPQSPVRGMFNTWMLMEGLLFLLGIPALYKHYHSVSGALTYTMILFIVVFAVGACVLTCFFSVNESKDIVTTASKIHGMGSVLGFILFLFVPLLLAILSFKSKDIGIGIVSVICFVLAMIFFVLFVMSDKPEFTNTFINNEGLWERLNLIFMYAPLVAVSVSQW